MVMITLLIKLFYNFFKIGLFTFGGGYAMVPLIQHLVTINGWMTLDDVVDFIAISEMTPGPLAINMSTYVGFKVAGLTGALCCTIGVALPSFIVILAISKAYKKYQNNWVVKGTMRGIKPAVVGLIGASVITVIGNIFGINNDLKELINVNNFITLVILAAAVFMLIKKKNPISIIFVSGLLGIIINCALVMI
jgi:chromate transporter